MSSNYFLKKNSYMYSYFSIKVKFSNKPNFSYL